MKIYKGKKRIALKGCERQYQRQLELFAQYKIGDYIHTCEGYNRRIVSIEYEWYPVKPGSKNQRLTDIIFTDSNGHYHYVSGLGCVYPPISNEEIIDYWLNNWLNDQSGWRFGDEARKMKAALDAGQPVLSEHGEPIF